MDLIFIFGVMTALGLLLTLAFAAERDPMLRWPIYGLLAAIDALLVLIGLPFLLATAIGALPGAPAAGGTPVERLLGGTAALTSTGLLLVALGVVGLLLLAPASRRLVARALPIAADRVVHAVALQYAVYLVLFSGITAVFLTALGDDPQALELLTEATAQSGLAGAWVQALGFVVIGFLGVGLLIARPVTAALGRLGLTRSLDGRWWLGATLLALASGYAVDRLWQSVAPESFGQVERLSEALFAPFLQAGLLGALTIALSAGIGEEILFRGAMQPRFGLLCTALLFTAVHTQYTVSPALLQVFVIGVLLGLTRREANTTTAVAVHASYNLVLALLALLAPELSP